MRHVLRTLICVEQLVAHSRGHLTGDVSMALGAGTAVCTLVPVDLVATFKAMIIEKCATDTQRANEQRTASAWKDAAPQPALQARWVSDRSITYDHLLP